MVLRPDSARSSLPSKLRRWLRSVSPDRLFDLPGRLAKYFHRAERKAGRPGIQRRCVRPLVFELEPRLQPNDILGYLAGTAIFGSGMLLTGDSGAPATVLARGSTGAQAAYAETAAFSPGLRQAVVVDAALGRAAITAAVRAGDTAASSAGADSATRRPSVTGMQTAGAFDPLSSFNGGDWSGSIESLFGNTGSHGSGDHFSAASARSGGGIAVSAEIARATVSSGAGSPASGSAPTKPVAIDAQSVGINLDAAGAPPLKQQPAAATNTAATGPSVSKPQAKSLGSLPVSFVPNVGQEDPSVRFEADTSSFILQLTDSSANFVPPDSGARDAGRTTLSMKFVGASNSATVVGLDKVSSVTNFVNAGAPSASHYNVPNYAAAAIENVYPGIDVVFFTNSSHALEYDFIVHAGADPSVINLQWAGNSGLSTDARGNLDLKFAGGTLVEQAPAAFQASAGTGQQNVAVSTVLHGNDSLGFRLGTYDTGRELVIDPTVIFSDYLGGSVNDFAFGTAIDNSQGSPQMIIAGSHWNASGPQTSPFYIRLTPGGQSIQSETIFIPSGQGTDYEASATAVAVDQVGSVYVASGDVRLVGGGTSYFGVVDKFAYDGTLKYEDSFGSVPSTRASVHFFYGIAVDSSGNAYVTGEAQTATAIVLGAPHLTYYAVAAGIKPDGSLAYNVEPISSWFTIPTASQQFGGYAAAVDNSGNVFLAGVGQKSGVGVGAYVWELSSGGAVEQSLLIGSANAANGIAVTANGGVDNVYVTGETTYDTFVTMNGVQPAFFVDQADHAANANAFVVGYQVGSGGFSEVYGSYIGGLGTVIGYGVAVDGAGDISVVGQYQFTPSTLLPSPEWQTVNPLPGQDSYPNTGPYPGTNYDTSDGFVVQINGASRSTYNYATYWGGPGPWLDTATGQLSPADNSVQAVALDPSGNVYVAGWTSSKSLSGGNTAAVATEIKS